MLDTAIIVAVIGYLVPPQLPIILAGITFIFVIPYVIAGMIFVPFLVGVLSYEGGKALGLYVWGKVRQIENYFGTQ